MNAPSQKTESLILGAALSASGEELKSNAAELAALSGLAPEDFSNQNLRLYWKTAVRMAELGRDVNATTVFINAKIAQQVPEGDHARLLELQASNTLTKRSFSEIAEAFRLQVRARQMAEGMEQLATDLRTRFLPAAQVSDRLKGLAAIVDSQWTPNTYADQDAIEIFQEWVNVGTPGAIRRPTVLPTYVQALDSIFGGWSPNANLVIGQPSAGKSALIATCMEAQLLTGMRVGFFALEDGTRWLSRRLYAKTLGIPVADVARGELSDEQAERARGVGEGISALLKNLVCYRFASIPIGELVRRATDWIHRESVQVIYLDHFGLVKHAFDRGQDHRFAFGESLAALRAVAERYNVPIVALMHTNRPEKEFAGTERPPRMTEIAESSYAERHGFKILGLWKRKKEFRCTVLKNKEGEVPLTIEFESIRGSAMFDIAGGSLIDLDAEKEAEAKARSDAKAAKARELMASKAATAVALKAEKAKAKREKDAQASLLD